MAKWWEYEAWRRRALQGIMWGLLLATFGMAAGLTAYKRSQGFGNEVTAGAYSIRLPSGWTITKPESPGLLVATATDSRPRKDGGQTGRQVFIYAKQLPAGTSVEEFLDNDRGTGYVAPNENDYRVETEIAGMDGVMVAQQRYKVLTILTVVPQSQYVAAVVRPDGQALAIRLTSKGPINEPDLRFFRILLNKVDSN